MKNYDISTWSNGVLQSYTHAMLEGGIMCVYDRTQEDVDRRKRKGYINADDLNRIEGNISIVAGYIGVPVETGAGWIIGGLPRVLDFRRIRDGVEKIRTGYAIRADTPSTPAPPLNTWKKWNDIEKILYDVCWLYIANSQRADYCGEIAAGEGGL